MTDIEVVGERKTVFLSYARKDRDRVAPFYDFLLSNGVDAWIDYKRLRPGQNWDYEIKRALEDASIVIAFLSHNSVIKRGYVQREVKYALDRRKEKMIDDIYVLPVLLDDDVDLPAEFADVHYASASSEDCLNDIRDAINDQLRRLGANIVQSDDALEKVRWSYTTYSDVGDGLPGYNVDYRIPALHSTEYAKLNEITEIIRGDCIKELMRFRKMKFEPSQDDFNYGQDRWMRNHKFSAACAGPIVTGRCVSLICEHHYYYARAAHPNMDYRTYNFILEPLFQIESITDIFDNSVDVFPVLAEAIRASLLKDIATGIDEDDTAFDREIIENGTSEWRHLNNFVFLSDGIKFLFPPYQVASYAHGPQSAKIDYELIYNFVSDSYLYALDLDRYIWRKRDRPISLTALNPSIEKE